MINSKRRKRLYKKYNFLYKLFCPIKELRYICFYCGLPAGTIDHIPPLDAIEDLKMISNNLTYTKVPSCKECNNLAGTEPHTDIFIRQKYIKEKIRKKYKKYIEFSDWEEEEINKLGYLLQTDIREFMSLKYLVISRLSYCEEETK